MTPEFEPAVPVLRVFDVTAAREFYLDYLGFRWDWDHVYGPNFPVYAQVSRGAVVLHLSEHHGDGTPGTHVFVAMTGIRDYLAELRTHDYRFVKPGIQKVDWGLSLDVPDPFGNVLSFCERTSEGDGQGALGASR